VTPDGTRAVGYLNVTTDWDARPVLYDLTTNKEISLSNLPDTDMNHYVSDYHAFAAISADGRYIVGRLSQEILLPISMCAYVYDTETDTVNYIGFTPNATKAWKPDYADCLFIDEVHLSANGAWATGDAYLGKYSSADDFGDEYRVGYRYNVGTDKFEAYDGAYDSDVRGYSIANDGTMFATTPAENPYSTMLVRQGNYYYNLEDIFSQAYGVDFNAQYGYDVSGKPILSSADGKTLVMSTGTNECYVMQMHEDWADATARVNLLSGYTASPASGSTFSTLSNIKVTFTRNVGVLGSASKIKLLDADGNTVRTALEATAADNVLSIGFRSTDLTAGSTYTVVIPSGFVTMTDDNTVSSGEIRIDYVGRASGPVSPVAIYPTSGSAFSKLDASTNPILVQYDATIAVADGAKAYLYRNDESEPYCEMTVALYGSNTISVYPLAMQYLYEGTTYKAVIPSGVVTDLSGSGANEEITLNYDGTYVRTVSDDDVYIFTDDCDSYDGFMFYDGDQLAPGSTPSSWGFTASVPWYIVREDNSSTDMALAAHSMFEKSGKADDWCVTPQLYIPDTQCYLTFDAQSYKKSKTDRLKVYAYTSDNVYSSLSTTTVDAMRRDAVLLFDQVLSPGATEEGLADEWTNYVVNLSDFAEKNVYLAFVNDNEDQSAVFIDNVRVIHDMKFLTTFTHKSAVVNQSAATVSGAITITSELAEYGSVNLTLQDAAGNAVSSISDSNVSLKTGSTYNFTFPEQLPLTVGTENRFYMVINLGDDRSTVTSTIKDLTFEPTRRVLIEEYSGRTCANCPLGFLAMDNLEKLYPGQIVPVLLRTYSSDPLGNGLEDYTSFLGLDNLGAPSATINRTTSCYPMVSVGTDYRFSGAGVSTDGVSETVCWLDAVVDLMKSPADADLSLSAEYDASTGKVTVPATVRFALDMTNRNVNVLLIILEDQLTTAQENNLGSYDDPDLGEYGKNGSLSARIIAVTLDNVARNVFGTTYNGTGGLIPSAITAGTNYNLTVAATMPATVQNAANTKVAMVLIDADTDQVINTATAPISVVNSAINEIFTDGDNADNANVEYFNLMGQKVAHPTAGHIYLRRAGSKVSKILY
jgi:hypothetical protein